MPGGLAAPERRPTPPEVEWASAHSGVDITREGVDKAYGLRKLRDASGIALDAMMFIGDAIFPGGNDYPAKQLGLDTVRVRDPQETLAVIAAIIACQK